MLAVALFDGNVVNVDFVRVEVRGPGSFTWYGRVRDYDRSDVVITVVDGMVAGGIGLASARNGQARSYQLQAIDAGRQLLQELDPALMPPEHPPDGRGTPPWLDVRRGAGKRCPSRQRRVRRHHDRL